MFPPPPARSQYSVLIRVTYPRRVPKPRRRPTRGDAENFPYQILPTSFIIFPHGKKFWREGVGGSPPPHPSPPPQLSQPTAQGMPSQPAEWSPMTNSVPPATKGRVLCPGRVPGHGPPRGAWARAAAPRGLALAGTRPQRGGGGTPPPPSTDPKIVARNSVLCRRRRRRRFCFRHTAGGEFFCSTPCVCTQNTQNFVENSKMAEKHKKVM